MDEPRTETTDAALAEHARTCELCRGHDPRRLRRVTSREVSAALDHLARVPDEQLDQMVERLLRDAAAVALASSAASRRTVFRGMLVALALAALTVALAAPEVVVVVVLLVALSLQWTWLGRLFSAIGVARRRHADLRGEVAKLAHDPASKRRLAQALIELTTVRHGCPVVLTGQLRARMAGRPVLEVGSGELDLSATTVAPGDCRSGHVPGCRHRRAWG